MILAALLGGLLLFAGTRTELKVAPQGTTIGGLAVGGLNRGQLREVLDTAGRPPVVVAHAGPRSIEIPATLLGLSLAIDRTIDDVLAAPRWRAWAAAGLHPYTRNVSPVITVNQVQLAHTVAELQQAMAVAVFPGDLEYRDGRIALTPPAPGQHLDPTSAVRALEQSMTVLPFEGIVQMPVTADASPSLQTVLTLAARAREILRDGIRLRAAGSTVQLQGADVAPYLTLIGNPVRLRLRPSFVSVAHALARQLNEGDGLLGPTPRILLTEQGDVHWRPHRLSKSIDLHLGGRAMPGAILEAVDRWVRNDETNNTVEIPVGVGSPASRPVNAVLGTFTTHFPCCEPRVTNISTIARTLDSAVVPMHGTFSLNGLVGPRTSDKGYLAAPTIVGGQLVDTVGGGISQFATTLFNAAYFAGMGLTAHTPHSVYISRYPPGREATVNYPEIDLQWSNPSSGPVVIRTLVTSTSITVSLYGHDDGQWVTSDTGPFTPLRYGNYQVRVTRTLHARDGTAMSQAFLTTYAMEPGTRERT